NRQGHQICHLTSPEQGWDGKVNGKPVDSGVFFYVIEATGTDGKKYKMSGDINIVKFVGGTGTSSGDEQ
ncbi:MAG: gliding motility-associated C-terminal domain-containing protein, partial [Muribaculaceae bacterium]|nr:gliding motility-associated C-terminal domain-containing protein [Muribaculaceae bacterium]